MTTLQTAPTPVAAPTRPAGRHGLADRSAERGQDHHRARAGRRLRAAGHRVEVLDGDEIREFLSAGLGFTREDRDTKVSGSASSPNCWPGTASRCWCR